MKTAIWAVFALLALCWTGMAALSVQITDALLAAMASDAAGAAVGASAQWQLPAWLALWIDPQAIEALQALWADTVRWLGAALPSAGGLASWLGAAIWIVWGVGIAGLLALAAALHWLAGKARAPAGLQRA